MQINSVVNMENLKLFEPSMLDEEEEHQVLPTVEDLAPHGLEELKEDTVCNTRSGQLTEDNKKCGRLVSRDRLQGK
jgi:hypothetical protein